MFSGQSDADIESFKNGFRQCMVASEAFLAEKEHIPSDVCSRMVNHLNLQLSGLALAAKEGKGNGNNAINMGQVSKFFSRNGPSINRLRRNMNWWVQKMAIFAERTEQCVRKSRNPIKNLVPSFGNLVTKISF